MLGEGLDKYQFFFAKPLKNDAYKLCTKFGRPMMMGTGRNYVAQKQQKRENSTLLLTETLLGGSG